MIHDNLTALRAGGQQVTMENPTPEGFSGQISAIAHGVAAKLDALYGFSEMITQQSIEIARQLEIPEEEIKSWTEARAMLESERKIVQSWQS